MSEDKDVAIVRKVLPWVVEERFRTDEEREALAALDRINARLQEAERGTSDEGNTLLP